MNKILYLIVIVIGFTLMSNTGCEPMDVPETADKIQSDQTKRAITEGIREVGPVNIVNYKELREAKENYELRDREDIICHAYLVNQMTGEIGQYLGRCLGYGLPYSVQFSNPMRVIDVKKELGIDKYESDGEVQVIPQPEPNGLFMPEGLSATWLKLWDPEKKEFRPCYIEPEIMVFPFKIK